MTKRERNIGICMIIVIVLWLYTTLTNDDEKPLLSKFQGATKKNQTVVAVKKRDDLGPLDLITLKSQLERNAATPQYDTMINPFVPIKKAEKPPTFDITKLNLIGVIFEQDVPYAIINDSILSEGDQIMDCTIERITQNRVTVVHGAERFILTLHPDSRKKGSQV